MHTAGAKLTSAEKQNASVQQTLHARVRVHRYSTPGPSCQALHARPFMHESACVAGAYLHVVSGWAAAGLESLRTGAASSELSRGQNRL